MGAAVLSGAAAGFASTFTAGVLNGQSLGDALKSSFKGAAIGALSAGLTYGVGSAAVAAGGAGTAGSAGFSVAEYGVKVAGHGVVQGAITELNGGKFIHGFYCGAISGGTEGIIGSIDNTALKYAATSAVGGTTSSISGGSFVNGAVTSAYVMMFNHDAHQEKKLNPDEYLPDGFQETSTTADLMEKVLSVGNKDMQVMGQVVGITTKGLPYLEALGHFSYGNPELGVLAIAGAHIPFVSYATLVWQVTSSCTSCAAAQIQLKAQDKDANLPVYGPKW